MTTATEYRVRLKRPWAPHQSGFVDSDAKRILVRAGRRGGKTVGVAIRAAKRFLAGHRVLYAAPTSDQLDAFWWEIKTAFSEPIDAGVLYKNESLHILEVPNTKQRLRAKTAWNADTLRGDYADDLILDEYQLMDENAWGLVGQPMLMDNNGDAIFIFTPPSVRTRSTTKAKNPQHARDFWRQNQDKDGWAFFHFASHENPHVSEEGAAEMARGMSSLAYRQEILAEDLDEVPGALWTREMLDKCRGQKPDTLERIIIGVDPAATSSEDSDETGIVVAGRDAGRNGYVLDDASGHYSPDGWARRAVNLYHAYQANKITAEKNQGGEMIEHTIHSVDATVPVELVHARLAKQVRAEPVAALYEQGRVWHCGTFGELEDQMCSWVPEPGAQSPDRVDALVYALTPLLVTGGTPNVRWL